MQRGEVEGVLCDVACTGRFYDFLEQRQGRWGIVFRQPIYEKDGRPTRLTRRPRRPETGTLRRATPRGTGTWLPGSPGGRPGEAGRRACPAPRPRNWSACTSAAPPGWPASRSALGPAGQHDLVGAYPAGLPDRPAGSGSAGAAPDERAQLGQRPAGYAERGAWTSTSPQEAASSARPTTGSPQASAAGDAAGRPGSAVQVRRWPCASHSLTTFLQQPEPGHVAQEADGAVDARFVVDQPGDPRR